eukprot:g9424.t1
MGRSSDPNKETALEALFEVMKQRKIPNRPGPSHELFFIVTNAISLWKGKTYWDDEELSKPTNKKKRDLLLQTISTWFDRRSKKQNRNKIINVQLLENWITLIQVNNNATSGAKSLTQTPESNPKTGTDKKKLEPIQRKLKRWGGMTKTELCSELTRLFKENEMLKETLSEQIFIRKRKHSTDLLSSTNSKLDKSNGEGALDTIDKGRKAKNDSNNEQHQHGQCRLRHHHHNHFQDAGKTKRAKTIETKVVKHVHGKSCGHRAILHKSPSHTEPHLDFLVDGVVDCQHQSMNCCKFEINPNEKYSGNFELVDEDFDIELDKLVELLE